jgi:hypothetical protein
MNKLPILWDGRPARPLIAALYRTFDIIKCTERFVQCQ